MAIDDVQGPEGYGPARLLSELGRLTPDHIRELVCLARGIGRDSSEAFQAIVNRTDGPFFSTRVTPREFAKRFTKLTDADQAIVWRTIQYHGYLRGAEAKTDPSIESFLSICLGREWLPSADHPLRRPHER